MLGGALQVTVTGSVVALPIRRLVLMHDGTRVAPKPFPLRADPEDSSSWSLHHWLQQTALPPVC